MQSKVNGSNNLEQCSMSHLDVSEKLYYDCRVEVKVNWSKDSIKN